MTTYELPPEPPVGTRVKDAEGNIWERIPSSDKRRWTRTNGEYAHSWSAMLTVVAPLTLLIESDPWPTEPLIVASIRERREVLARNEVGGYESPVMSAWRGGPTLTNVVPVTVVPVAGLDELRACIKALGYGTQGGTRGMPDSLLDTALRLLDATDALGVDL